MSGSSRGGYSITISAVDAASGVFDKLNQRAEALNKRITAAQAPFKRLGESFDKFTKTTGLDKIATGFGNVARSGTAAFRSMMRVIEPLAAITGATSLAGIYKLTSAWASFGNTLNNQAQRAGTTAAQLYTIQNAAHLVGVSASSTTSAVTSLNDNLRNAAFGGGASFLTTLRAIGISYDDLKTQNPEQQFETVSKALANVRSATDKALYTKEIFGGEDILPFLNQSADGIAKLVAQAKELAGTWTPADIKNAQDFNTAQQGLIISTRGLGRAFASTLAPVLTPFIGDITRVVVHMREWVATNQDWLRAEIGTKLHEFVDFVQKIPWKDIGQGIHNLLDDANRVATAFGGWKNLLEGILALKFTAWSAGVVAQFIPIIRLLALIPGSGVTAAVLAAAGLGYLGYQGAKQTGSSLAKAGEVGLTPGMIDEFGNPIYYRDARGKMYTPDEAAKLTNNRRFNGEGDYPDQTRPPAAALPPGAARDNARAIARVFSGAGLTKEGSAALLGSAEQESSFDPKAGAGSSHKGIFQLSDTRRAAVERQFGKPLTSMSAAEQAQAALWEIRTNPSFGPLNSRLHTSHDLAANNNDVTRVFEAPGNYDTEVPHRLSLSQAHLRDDFTDEAQGDPAPLPAPSGTPGANGQVDMNVTVNGGAKVTAKATGGINMKIAQPGLLAQ